MPDPTGTRLEGRTPVSSTTVHGRNAVGLGGLILAFGLVILALLRAHPERARVPLPIAFSLAALFPVGGALFLAHGLRGLARQKRLSSMSERFPTTPWLWDHSWCRHGIADDAPRMLRRVVGFITGACAILLPMNWIVFTGTRTRGSFLQSLLLLFDLMLLVALGYGAILLLRLLRYGRGRLRFTRFPYLLGQPLVVDFVGGRTLRRCSRLTATLRFVEERYEPAGDGTRIACHQLYAASQQFSSAALTGPEGRMLRIEFALPEGKYETCLREEPPRYWELEVEAEAPGLDYKGRFLLPVYLAPSSTGSSSA